ncbi:HDIG domain-containing metalloprotein [Pelagicoccus sp. SDUM812003]|uniref:HD family phosphohydrolase n=1 Tax=Pelagicoccus sp. SDUM812003 TaxID=3041267 RepID=UPI00280FC87F|nr:HDIG domain-containing metalloprotein [Pelagicoccus sp. SDUM812003]MDQ8202821.1 HDIG domain-containing protein [Pelagicoccus sp. SDUM812003]
MPFSEQFKAWIQKAFPHKKRKRRTETPSTLPRFLEESPAVGIAVFVLTVAAIVVTTFVGIKPTGFQILPNQVASIRIVAGEEFSYRSKILSERKQQQLLEEVPHVYRIDMGPYNTFKEHVEALIEDIEDFKSIDDDLTASQAEARIESIANDFNARGGYRLSPENVAAMLDYANVETLKELINTGLISIEESYKLGIYDEDDPTFNVGRNAVAVFQIVNQENKVGQKRVESIDDALRSVRINLGATNVPPKVAESVIRLFRDALKPNLRKSAQEMERLREKMRASFEPVIVQVQEGESIIEPGQPVTPEQHEQLVAYQRHLAGKNVSTLDNQLFGRILLVLAMVIAATFFIRLEHKVTFQSNGRLGLLALLVVINLILVRACFELGNFEAFLYDNKLSAILPYITPTVLAPILVAVLIGTGPGLLMALMISLFTAVMFGNRLDLLVMSFLASTVGIYFCRNLRKRGRVVTAGFFAGVSVAIFTLLFNRVDGLPWPTIIYQMTGGLLTGLAEGVLVVGLLPILEGIFRRTTDITLLELCDYNHPILRRMQMEAPGSWHHSLMVANLAENACNAIGANGLLARVACMFHDIGKLVKPEYFTENQLDGFNPHDEKSPSFSALVIKSHVKEGVDLGLTYKLPRPVIDVIRQHHGTNLIRFFFHKAKQKADHEAHVQESTYRYDGPKPQFKESAVILLADSVEAASRSLAKVTPQNVEELVDRIFQSNIDDGQLNDCPITIAEVAAIRESFIFTLLNSLHSRIAYPGQKPIEKPSKKSDDRKNERAAEAGASK